MEKTFQHSLQVKRTGIVICFISLLCLHLFPILKDEHLVNFNINILVFFSFAVFFYSAFALFYKTGIAYWGYAKWHYKNLNKNIDYGGFMDDLPIIDERQIDVVNNAHRQSYILLSIILCLLIILEKWSSKSLFLKISYQSLSSAMIYGLMLIPLAIIAWNEKED